MKRLMSNEKGAAMALISIMMVVFIAMICLIIDFGRVYVFSHELQKVLDAGTLAATTAGKSAVNARGEVYAYIEYPKGETIAKRVVNENFNLRLIHYTSDGKLHAFYNSGKGDGGKVEHSNGKIHIVGTIHFKTIFLGMFGLKSIDITRDSWGTVKPIL